MKAIEVSVKNEKCPSVKDPVGMECPAGLRSLLPHHSRLDGMAIPPLSPKGNRRVSAATDLWLLPPRSVECKEEPQRQAPLSYTQCRGGWLNSMARQPQGATCLLVASYDTQRIGWSYSNPGTTPGIRLTSSGFRLNYFFNPEKKLI
ncbi:hypothetical protein RUM43_004873 [Polyplax serrata]|uniref:Uncharacterized protein n=1 Tax=Polyplax serrata TaxID=468196 RepID=A0AAN8SBA7_POLSC